MQRLVEQAQTPSDNHYDVVLLDEVMPGLDGPGMARRILALPWTAQRPRLLLVSPPGMLGHDGRSGCDGGVSKPLSARQLGAALDRLDPSPSHAGTPSGVSRQETALHGLRVLLVEDNEVNREVAGDLLRLEGVVVGEAHNGADAIAVLRTQEFDAVLMDINMPVMDGIAATRAIRADPALAGNVIIGLSASVLPGDRDSCLAAGMDDFLGKPVIPAQLYETLRRLLGKTEHPADAAPTSTLADAVEALASTPQLQRLRGIQQLDVTAALGRLEGHEALYLRLVQRVLADRRLEGGALIAAQRAGDQEAAIRFSHNLASIAGSLGADMLRERCRALEKSLHAGQRDAQLVADVVEQSAALWRSLQQAFADTDDDIAGEQRSVR
jgi:two-component system sensor histidine kinase/response regulator